MLWKVLILPATLSLTLITGCANPLKYARMIDGFAAATKQAEKTVVFLSSPRPGEYERLIAYAIDSPGSVKENLESHEQSCSTNSSGCELWVKDADDQERRLTAQSVAPEILKLLSGISAYADDLKRIAVANREQEIRVALGSVTQNVGAIAQHFGRQVPLDVEIGSQAAAMTAWLVGQYHNRLKLSALREATKKGEAALPEITDFLGTMGSLLTEKHLSQAQLRLHKARQNFKLGECCDKPAVRLAKYRAAASQFDALLRLRVALQGNGPSVFRSMRDAHTKLHNSLHEESTQNFDVALGGIEAFLSEAERFAKIIEQLE